MLTLVIILPVAVALVAGAVEHQFLDLRKRAAELAAADPPGQDSGPRVSLAAESLAYVGALLILAGGAIVTQRRWLHLANSERVEILAGAALILLLGGFVVRWVTASPADRLTETMWLASAAAAAGATATASAGGHGHSGGVTVLVVCAQVAGYAFILWILCRRELLAVVMFAGLVGTLCSAIAVTASGSRAPWLAVALGLWLLGIAWAVLGLVYPQPLGTSVIVGATVALLGPAVAVHQDAWVYVVGIVTAAAVLVASVPLKNVVMLAFGSTALFGYLTAAAFRFFDRSLGGAETLMITGGLLIILAALTVWLGRMTRPAGETTASDFRGGGRSPAGRPAGSEPGR